jgi:hypothetical protein
MRTQSFPDWPSLVQLPEASWIEARDVGLEKESMENSVVD